ncbi:MAG: carbon-phosphorus lyase complex subunit PhnI [Desulfobacteraceae bacterium]|nr:carbon-phosphorus lyase complex subunit PhnI [Desulfobacteraceae bacterium]
MYVAVKGGEKAIENAHRLLEESISDPEIKPVEEDQIKLQFPYAIDRIMAEGSLYDKDIASKAFKKAQGDIVEAVFLVRAFRNTIKKLGYTRPLDTERIDIKRRISAVYKDIPGGQILGKTFDYTHRLIDFEDSELSDKKTDYFEQNDEIQKTFPRVTEFLKNESLLFTDPYKNNNPKDITNQSLEFPVSRDMRLQAAARGDEGFLLSLAYSYQRGFGADSHPFAAEIRTGDVEIIIIPDELGFEITIGKIEVTEVVMVDSFKGTNEKPPQFASGYGLSFGKNERKAMSMAIIDRAMRFDEFCEESKYPSQNHEFVISHCDNVEASGFVSHLKLPHYVDFQSELLSLKRLRQKHENNFFHQDTNEVKSNV